MIAQQDAAKVLAAHRLIEPGYEVGPDIEWCSCGLVGEGHNEHQADMLAAAGLLVTPEAGGAVVNSLAYVADIPLLAEHDAQVATRALRAFAEECRSHATVAGLFNDDAARGLCRAADLAGERADRIEREGLT